MSVSDKDRLFGKVMMQRGIIDEATLEEAYAIIERGEAPTHGLKPPVAGVLYGMGAVSLADLLTMPGDLQAAVRGDGSGPAPGLPVPISEAPPKEDPPQQVPELPQPPPADDPLPPEDEEEAPAPDPVSAPPLEAATGLSSELVEMEPEEAEDPLSDSGRIQVVSMLEYADDVDATDSTEPSPASEGPLREAAAPPKKEVAAIDPQDPAGTMVVKDRLFDREAEFKGKVHEAKLGAGDVLVWDRPDGGVERYTITEELGRGAMGVVFEALRSVDGQDHPPETVALKTAFTTHPHQIASLQAEAFLTKLPGEIRRFVGVGQAIGQVGDIHFLCMERLWPDPLTYLREQGRVRAMEGIDPKTAIDIYLQLLQALVALHRFGIVHGDIKPENIMLRMPHLEGEDKVEGYVKNLCLGKFVPVFVDWGCVWNLNDGDPALVTGTPTYMAPEHFLEGVVSRRKDGYALSLVLYEYLSGKPPFHGHAVESFEDVVRLLTSNVSPIDRRQLVDRPSIRYYSGVGMDRPNTYPRDLLPEVYRLIEMGARREFTKRASPQQILKQCWTRFGVAERSVWLPRRTLVRLTAGALANLDARLHPYKATAAGARLVAQARRHGSTTAPRLGPRKASTVTRALRKQRQERPASPDPAPPSFQVADEAPPRQMFGWFRRFRRRGRKES